MLVIRYGSTKANITSICTHTYILGKCKSMCPTLEQSTILGCSFTNIEVFFRLFKDGVTYHSSSYKWSTKGKRNNTLCCYHDESDGGLRFAQIYLFANTNQPYALVCNLRVKNPSLMKQAGYACRSNLLD